MSQVFYLDLIRKLEDEKWAYIAKYGQAGIQYWPPIDAKLDKLYKWYTRDYLAGNVKIPTPNRRVIKAGTY